MPEFEAIKPDLTGDFFEQDNPKDLADKIKKWTSLTPEKRMQIKKNAYNEIDKKWNIHYQIKVIKDAIDS